MASPSQTRRLRKKGRESAILRALDHGQRHLRQGIGQPLVIDPLAAQDIHQADQDQIERRVERQPAPQGHQPSVPRNRRIGSYALVKGPNSLDVRDDHPVGQVRMDQLGPLVFWRGVVQGAGDHRQQQPHYRRAWEWPWPLPSSQKSSPTRRD